MALNPDDLTVDSFDTTQSLPGGGGYCCTGCDSGCGYYPTGGGCESGSDGGYCPDTIVIAA